MIPIKLKPNSFEVFEINNLLIEIPKCSLSFEKWNGDTVKETFGGKKIVAFENKPMFAELAILNIFINDGSEARWIGTYGTGKNNPKLLTNWKDDKYINQERVPISDNKIATLLQDISQINNNTHAGCWDIFAWKNGTYVFAEAKRHKKDRIRSTQNKWLESSLKHGLKPDNFLVVEWDI